MKIKINKKTFFHLTIILLIIPYFAFAWTGYDYDNKTEIEISEGNLVREGLIIQFYDSKLDSFHSAKVLLVEEIAGGTRIQIKDLDSKKERFFIMQN